MVTGATGAADYNCLSFFLSVVLAMKSILPSFALCLALCLGLSAGPASAQQSGGVEACKEDAQKYCSGVAFGGGKIRECLAAHADALSPACQSVVQGGKGGGGTTGAGGSIKAFTSACQDDVKSFCKAVQPGGGRIIDCLIDHQKEISDACYAVLKKRQDGQGSGAAQPN